MNYSKLKLCIIVVVCIHACFSHAQNITINTQAEIDSFHINYPSNEIKGSLFISGNEINNLMGLSHVERIADF